MPDINRDINIEDVDITIEVNKLPDYQILFNGQGPQGATGPRGPEGPRGERGDDGFSPIATVTQTETGATISVTDASGTTTADITNGADGQAATISVGTVTTGLPTDPASVTNVGTSSAAVFDFTIPKGDKGDTGSTGPTGNGISNIEKTSTSGLVDTYTITYTNSDTDTFNVTNGQDGQAGAAATIAVGTVTTGAAGSSASVVNSGTSSAAIFDFTIPKGDKGDTGNTGATGNGIDNISLISTVGLQKTYRITYTNGSYYDYVVTDGADGASTWGNITGTLSNQTDLQDALDLTLRTKNTAGTGSFIDTKAGTSTYPTTGANIQDSIIIGDKAYHTSTTSDNISSTTIIGNQAYGSHSYQVAIGTKAHALGTACTAIGYGSNASNGTSTAVGYQTSASGASSVCVGCNTYAASNYTVVVGAGASTISQYSTVIGYGSSVSSNATYATVIGQNATVSQNCTNSVALGRAATVTGSSYGIAIGASATAKASGAIQLGSGENNQSYTFQVRNWQLLNSDGKIPMARLFDNVKLAGVNPPDLYDWVIYRENDNKVEQEAYLWTGEDNSVFTKDTFYQGKVKYSYPIAKCVWANESWITSKNNVIIDQEKFYKKLAEISQARINDDDTVNSVVGGGFASQDIYIYYNGDSQQWWVEFSNYSFESGDTTTPESYYLDSSETLEDFGIYINEDALTLPTDDNDEEMFDLEYYAPVYCNEYDFSSNMSCTINYMKFMDTMCDSDWGFGKVITDLDNWEYEVGENSYVMPLLPPTYEYNDEEWDYIKIRFEVDQDQWTLYIDDEDTGYAWEQEQLLSTFGIDIPDYMQDSEYIELVFKPSRQCIWQQFNPIDESTLAIKQEFDDLSASVRRIEEYKAFKRIQSARDLNTMTTAGQYRIEAIGCTNLPINAANSIFMWLFVSDYATSGTQVRQVLITDYANMAAGTSNYTRYAPNIFVRCKLNGTWSDWKPLLTDECSPWIAGYDKDKTQFLIHTASNNTMLWQEVTALNPTYDSVNERITW